MRDFAGRTAVITGGASGIGMGLAIAAAHRGMNVAVADVDIDAARAVAAEVDDQGGEAIAVQCDVASIEDVAALADRVRGTFGDVHLLCNNAGVSARRNGIRAVHEDWTWMVGVNLWGVIHGIECFLPQMVASGSPAHIVNTSSIQGLFPSGLSPMYSATKYGVLGLTETLSNELRDTSVGVSVLCPGPVSTRILESERNRPSELRGTAGMDGDRPSASYQLGPTLLPEQVSEMVFDGVANDRLFIFTDPSIRSIIEERHQHIMSELDELAGRLGKVGAPSSRP